MTIRRILYSVIALSSATCAFGQNPGGCKCCSEEARQFDFWIGDWEVEANGKPAGHNSILLKQDSCVLQENWTSANGTYTGTSYNFYNTQSGKWQQLWLDNHGGNLQLEGVFKDGIMLLASKEFINPQGQKQLDKITWTPHVDGTVQQLWERSTDGGTTWTKVFDGLYKRAHK